MNCLDSGARVSSGSFGGEPAYPASSGGFGRADGFGQYSLRPSAPQGLASGDVVAGKYAILGLLGAGGMGTVWRAHSLALDIDVALKVVRQERGDEIASARLRREAQATARLGHPAIVRVFDFGQTDEGEPFLVMELIEGESLAEWLAFRGRVPAAQAVQMLLPIASGLAAAHAQGVVHRDVKPENILIVPGRDGVCAPKIVDFGIAKLATSTGEVLTQEGMILGSLPYMSPEQADGREVDQQADVWALCVVLYELITGHRPFEGQTLAPILLALHTKLPTPTTDYAAGDAELWAIISRGLKKTRAARWPTMRALGEALAVWAIERGVTTDATGASLERHWLGRSSDAFGTTARPVSERTEFSVCMTERSVAAETPDASDLPALLPEQKSSTELRSVPPPKSRNRLRTALVALVAAPVMLGLVGLCSRGWTATASADEPPTALPAHATFAPPAAPRPMVTPVTTSEPAPAAHAATAEKAAAPGRARDVRGLPANRRKLTSLAMPLPPAPTF